MPGDDDADPFAGALWILFTEPDGTVGSQVKITQEVSGFTGRLDAGDQFGLAVAPLGDLDGDGVPDVAVGAPHDDDGSSGAGAVWLLFLEPDGTVASHRKLTALTPGIVPPPSFGSQFGSAVARLGDVDGDGTLELAVGATMAGPDEEGAVWIVSLEADGDVAGSVRIADGEGGFGGPLAGDDWFGGAVGAAGDLDGDGTAELLVGALLTHDVTNDTGVAWLLSLDDDAAVVATRRFGESSGGLSQYEVYAMHFEAPLADGDRLGSAAVVIGDVDGNGADDLAVAAPGADDEGGGADEGSVWILFRDADGTVPSQQELDDDDAPFGLALAAGDRFGASLAAPGDVDGNGVPDLVVGVPERDTGGSNRGAVVVLFLAADGTVVSHREIAHGTSGFGGALANGDRFGSGVAALGDLDGNGVPDLAVGAPNDSSGGGLGQQGAVWIVFLAADGTVVSHAKLAEGVGGFAGALDDADHFGAALALLGDLDADGTPELAVGAPDDDDGGVGIAVNTGAVWIVSLDDGGAAVAQGKISTLSGGFAGELDVNDRFGSALAGLGDVDGDGVPDLAVGAPGDDDGGVGSLFDAGAAWVLRLDTDGTVDAHTKISATAGSLEGPLAGAHDFGASLAALGDLDGDGLLDLAAGAPGDGYGVGTDRGTLWLLFLTDGRWTDLGHALAGTSGAPSLVGTGELAGGTPVALTLTGALPVATAWFVVGPSAIDAPFKGGVLVPDPAPPGFVLALATDLDGELVIAGTWPGGLPPGFAIFYQLWIADPGGPAGFAASNAVVSVTP